MITPQPQESGYWMKVLTSPFGLAGCGRGVFLREKLGLGQRRRSFDSMCSLQTLAYAKVWVNTIV